MPQNKAQDADAANQGRPETAAGKENTATVDSDARAFLPAALEVLETPASPAARWTAISLAAFFCIALAWALIGTVDVVAVAQGRIVPAGGVKQIQPLEIGVVRAIHVRDGMSVKKGDVLVELDPTDSEVDKNQLEREVMTASIELARLHAMTRRLDGRPGELQAPEGADQIMVTMQRQRLASDYAAHDAEMASMDAQLASRLAERQSILAEIEKLEETLPLIEEREQSLAALVQKGISPKPNWLEVRTLLIESRQNIAIERHRLVESEAAIEAAVRESNRVEAEAKQKTFTEMLDARKTYEQATLALRKAQLRENQQSLRAPENGVVQQLNVHTVGGVVQPAEALMLLVPDDVPLEISAMVLNKDKGFVRAGLSAEVKVESFPFTKYGTIDAEVRHLSGDAIQDENLGPVYEMKVNMDRYDMSVDGETVRLVPGMNVTVEVKTGERRLIEFVLSPLLRYQDEALRER